eukprot:3840680-Prymnesium_polylepis.1
MGTRCREVYWSLLEQRFRPLVSQRAMVVTGGWCVHQVNLSPAASSSIHRVNALAYPARVCATLGMH